MNYLRALMASAVVALVASAVAQPLTYTFSYWYLINAQAVGIAAAPDGGLVVTTAYGLVKKLSATGVETNFVGTNSYDGVDGVGAAARFNSPSGIVCDSTGNYFIADTGNNAIRKVTPAGVVTTFAGTLRSSTGYADGTGSTAKFAMPMGLAIDKADNLYVADSLNAVIRKITPAGVVTTVAGSPGVRGTADGTGTNARFNNPNGVAVDANGNVFVADTGNSSIRKITPGGAVTTFAGSTGNAGALDGAGTLARFSGPFALAFDGSGILYVADTGNRTIRYVSAAGVVTTLGGTMQAQGSKSGVGAAAQFYAPRAITVDGAGNLFLGDDYYLKLGVPSGQVAFTVAPQSRTIAAGSAAVLSATATGAAPITYQWQKNGVAITGATAPTLTFPSVQAGDAASYTVSATNSVGTVLSPVATLSVVAPLPNDNFENAQVLTGLSGSVSGTTQGATAQPGEPTHYTYAASNVSVWYRWTPTSSGTVWLSLGSAFSRVIAVYTGSSLTTLTPINSSGWGVSFRAVAGQTYDIAVGNYYSNDGAAFTLSWNTVTNDDFANAATLTGDSGTVTASFQGATTETGEPQHSVSGGNAYNSVWYRWTPGQTGNAIFRDQWTIVELYTGTSLTNLTRVDGGYSTGMYSSSTVPVTAGTTYWIAVSSTNGASSDVSWSIDPKPAILTISYSPSNVYPMQLIQGTAFSWSVTAASPLALTYQWYKDGTAISGATSATLSFSSVQSGDTGKYSVTVSNTNGSTSSGSNGMQVLIPPANDNFASAQEVTGMSGSVTGSNQTASGGPGEPVHWNLYGTASSIWYKWVAPTSGLAAIDTTGSQIDTVMAVYTGASLSSLTRLTQDDDRGGGGASLVNFSATAGMTYYIAVGGATSVARGNLKLNWQLTAVLAIVTPPTSQTVAVGGSATFTVNATGASATYQWYRNSVAIPGATSTTLTVGSVNAGDDASYTVAVTNSSGTVTSTPATLAVAAPQLTTLSIRNSVPHSNWLWSIAAGGGQIVTVGDGGTILTSGDGRTWVNQISGTTNWLVGVTYGGEQFVAVGDKGTILTSPEAQNWVPVTTSGTTARLNNVLYAAGKFVAVGEAGTIVTSDDGHTWTPRATGVTGWLHGLVYNADIGYFAATGQGGVFLYSSDAVTWNQLPISGFTDDLEAVVAVTSYANFVTVGSSGKVVAVHKNDLVLKTGDKLTTWTADVNQSGSGVTFRGLAAGASALFASGEGGKVITAMDASGPWLTIPSGTSANLVSGLYYNNTLYLVGQDQTIVQSDPLYSPRLINISTRCLVGTGDNVLISGFVVNGTTPKQVLIRAAGPALTQFGISGTLAAPVLRLFDSSSKPITSNTGWGTATNADTIAKTAAAVGAFPFAQGSADSAILVTLLPGSYTAQVSGASGATGVAIVEVYDADPLSTQTAQAVNLSSRGAAGTSDNKMIAGFVINGASSRRVLIRAVGPGLAAAPFNMSGTLTEPQIELYNSKGLLKTTAGAWGLQANADEIRSAAAAVGAFPLAEGSKDSATVLTLLPGAWTVQVSGANNTSGVVITEVYVLP